VVSKSDSTRAVSHANMPYSDLNKQSEQGMNGLANLVEKISPALFEVGSWLLGGLIALNLVVLGALITVGAIGPSILISATALACALPLNVAGIFLLRLIKDAKEIGIDDLALQAFREADFPNIDAYFPAARDREVHSRRRSNAALLYSFGIIALSFTLTVIGLVAALWHLAWWLGVTMLAMVILSAVLVMVILAHALPPETKAEKELKKLYQRQVEQEKRK
jgi:MFS family permease